MQWNPTAPVAHSSRASLRAACLLAALAIGLSVAAAEWPQFRGPLGDGVSPEKNLPEKWSLDTGVEWQVPLPGRANSSPAITSRRIDLTTQTEDDSFWLISLDRTSGELLHKVNVGQGRLEMTAPPELVAHRHNAATPTPVANDDFIWAFFGNGLLVCVSAESGAIQWQRDLARDYGSFDITFGMASSPRLWGNLLILTVLGKKAPYVVALQQDTGETVWKTPRPADLPGDSADAYSSPVLWQREKQIELIVSGAGRLNSYHPRTGKPLWSVEGLLVTGPVGRVIASPAVGRRTIVAASANPTGGGKGRLLGVVDAERKWLYSRATPDSSTPVIVDRLVYMVSDQGLAACLEAESGKMVWEKRLGGGPYHASVVAGDDKVYFLGIDGVCTVVQQGRSGRIVSRNVLPGTFYATPAICEGRLYLRAYEALYSVNGAGFSHTSAGSAPASSGR